MLESSLLQVPTVLCSNIDNTIFWILLQELNKKEENKQKPIALKKTCYNSQTLLYIPQAWHVQTQLRDM